MTPVENREVDEERWQGVIIGICFTSIPVGLSFGLCALTNIRMLT